MEEIWGHCGQLAACVDVTANKSWSPAHEESWPAFQIRHVICSKIDTKTNTVEPKTHHRRDVPRGLVLRVRHGRVEGLALLVAGVDLVGGGGGASIIGGGGGGKCAQKEAEQRRRPVSPERWGESHFEGGGWAVSAFRC